MIVTQPTVYLMPTPVVKSSGEINLFDLNLKQEKSNEVQVLFATNRMPTDEAENRIYTIFPGKKLRMGIVHIRIGKEETGWENIFKLSTSAETDKRPALIMEKVQELAQYPLKDKVTQSVNAQLQNVQSWADMVNHVLADSIDKDITIYVHGANTSVYRASAQAAQYHHFTGQNSLVLAFLWPSAENLFAYGTDMRHALHSAPAFAQLLTMLAEHTNAKNINILAYSAGAQIVSPALDIIGRNTKEGNRKDLRLGEVYFAAGDIGVDTFVKHLQSYIDMPRSTTLAINLGDSVLAWAARHNKVSRAGRPSLEDLSVEKNQWVRNATMKSKLTIIKVNPETVRGLMPRSHDFWYAHPWVSSDVLTQFLFHNGPGERGLTEVTREEGLRYWTFPSNYPEIIVDIVAQAKETRRE